MTLTWFCLIPLKVQLHAWNSLHYTLYKSREGVWVLFLFLFNMKTQKLFPWNEIWHPFGNKTPKRRIIVAHCLVNSRWGMFSRKILFCVLYFAALVKTKSYRNIYKDFDMESFLIPVPQHKADAYHQFMVGQYFVILYWKRKGSS